MRSQHRSGLVLARLLQQLRLLGLLAIAGAIIFVAAEPGFAGKGNKGGAAAFTLVPLPHHSGSMDEISYAEGLHELQDEAGELVGMEVVGISGGDAHYWMLDADGNMLTAMALPLPAGADPETTVTAAKDINDEGIIVGSAGSSGAGTAFFWPSFLESPTELRLPDGFDGNATAININNNGLIVGWLSSATEESIVVWGLKTDGDVVGPIVLGADAEVWAPDVNDAGIVVGTIQYQAYRWQVDWDGESLSASAAESLWAGALPLQSATGVNEQGDICGHYSPNGRQTYLLTTEGVLIDMPYVVDNRRYATRNLAANDLNDAATVDSIQVVGYGHVYRRSSGIIETLSMELLWQGDQAVDLDKAISQQTSDMGLEWIGRVSNAGWMAGHGWTNEQARAIVLVPTQ